MKNIYTHIFVLIFYRILSTFAESCVGLDPGRCCQVPVYKTLCPAICGTAVCLRLTSQPPASANNIFLNNYVEADNRVERQSAKIVANHPGPSDFSDSRDPGQPKDCGNAPKYTACVKKRRCEYTISTVL